MIKKINNDKGFSIIEVLIGAVVFMIGFSTLILLLNSVFVKFSVKELELANSISQEIMLKTSTMNDTTSIDSVYVKSNLKFNISKKVEIEDKLVNVYLIIYRKNSNKNIIELYNEYILP